MSQDGYTGHLRNHELGRMRGCGLDYGFAMEDLRATDMHRDLEFTGILGRRLTVIIRNHGRGLPGLRLGLHAF